MISQFLLVLGCALILHAAYSLQHYRSLLQDLIESSTGVSIDVDEASTNGDISASVMASTISQVSAPAITYRIPPFDIYIELSVAFAMLLVSEFIRPGSSMQKAVSVKGEKSKQNQTKPILAAPFISRDYDIYTTRKSKLR